MYLYAGSLETIHDVDDWLDQIPRMIVMNALEDS
jgi:hypothetical protein